MGGRGGGKGKGSRRQRRQGQGGGKGKGGKGKGGKGKGGKAKGGSKTVVEPHRHKGIFISRGKEDVLVTRNLVAGDAVYGEKRISTEEGEGETKTKVEYRVWNPFRSKLAAAVLGGVDDIHIAPGSKVLYLGAASGTSVSHVSDIVGEERLRVRRRVLAPLGARPDQRREEADEHHPDHRGRAPPDQVPHAHRDGRLRLRRRRAARPGADRRAQLAPLPQERGHTVISIKANCIDSTAPAEAVFAKEIEKLQAEQFKPIEQLTLEPYERDHAVVVAEYRPSKKQKTG